MEGVELESGRIPTWRHLNDEIRLKGLSGTQWLLGVLMFFMSFTMGIKLVPVVVIIEVVLFFWYQSIIENNDANPLVTRNVKNASPKLIQDKSDFYNQLMNPEDGE